MVCGVTSNVTSPLAREHTMTKVQGKGEVIAIKSMLEGDPDFIRASVRSAIEAALEAEIRRRLARRRANGPRPGWATRLAITSVR
jgi:hypothetical protein